MIIFWQHASIPLRFKIIFSAWTLPLLQLVIPIILVLVSSRVVEGTPATTGVVVIQIPDGQIQDPVPTKTGLSFFSATDIAGHEIFYVGSVKQNTVGSPITDLYGTVTPMATTNSAG